MMTLIAAAAAAATQPVASAPATALAQHEQHMQMGHAGEHKGMECCKDCCKDMAAMHERNPSQHQAHHSH